MPLSRCLDRFAGGARRARNHGLVLVALSAAACAAVQQPATHAPGHRTIAEGYGLLYGITSQQKGLKKLLWMKLESDPLDRVISDIADYAGELSGQLEDMASRYPALTVHEQFLPPVEVKARRSIADALQDTFLSTSGREFARELLLNQRSTLQQEQHLAKVMVEIETADERRAFWRRVDERFGGLRDELETLLRNEYFCD